MCRDGVRKVKAHLELNVMRDMKGNKKGFCRYNGNKGEVRENVAPLLNDTEDLGGKGQAPAASENVLSKEGLSSLEKDPGREYINKLNKSMGPDRKHPQLPR